MEVIICVVLVAVVLYVFVWPLVSVAMLALLGIRGRATDRKVERIIEGKQNKK